MALIRVLLPAWQQNMRRTWRLMPHVPVALYEQVTNECVVLLPAMPCVLSTLLLMALGPAVGALLHPAAVMAPYPPLVAAC